MWLNDVESQQEIEELLPFQKKVEQLSVSSNSFYVLHIGTANW